MKAGEIWVRYPPKYIDYISVIIIKSRRSDGHWLVDAHTKNGNKVTPFVISRNEINEEFWKFYGGAENENW